MKRALIGGIALVSVLGFTAGAIAQEPAPPPTPIGEAGRFQQLDPADYKITGQYSSHDPEQVVSATVVLAGESVLAAQNRSERLNRSFDAASTERQVAAQQSSVLPGLEAAGATIRSTTKNVLNAATVRVKVKDLAALAAVPGVATVHVSYQLHRFNGVSDIYTGTPSVWAGPGLTGEGMTIGVIDDGIDYYHATFGGSGDPAEWNDDDGTAVEAGTFPTSKVIGGYDFVGDAYDAGADQVGETDIPDPDADPLACGEHGTHVSGTAAGFGVLDDGSTYTGPYDATTIDANDWLVAPGSAPEASIRIYKVFGCDGSVNDDVLLDAIEMAVVDGVDVINMSLGSTWGTADEPLAVAIDQATAAGVLSVVSAGNEGPAAYQVGGPSTADTALSVAAIDTSSTTLPGIAITGDVTLAAQNSNLFEFTAPVTGVLVDVGLGCTLGDFAGASGKIAIAARGVCDRVWRAQFGTTAGALAVVFVNSSDSYPPVEGIIAGASIPFVGVPASQGDQFVPGDTITIDASGPIANPAYSNFADFTSNGPRQIDSAPKPDISAPGVNILSALVGSGTAGELLSGTSMAAPHAAGIALLVRQAHPSWGPTAVKAAMMSTANPDGIGDFNPLRGGTGVVSAPDAVDTMTYLSTSDGRNSLAFGFRQLTGSYLAARSITINNTTGSPITYDMSAEVDDLGVDLDITFNPAVVTVPAGGARSVSVSLSISDPQNLPGADANTGGDLAAVVGLVAATPRTSGPGLHQLLTTLVLVPYGVSDVRSVGMTAQVTTMAMVHTVASIKIANAGVHGGFYDTYQWAITDPKGDVFDSRVPDVRDVGVQQFPYGSDELVVFNISTNERATTQVTGEYDVWIDADDDGWEDYLLVGIDNGLFTGGTPDGQMTAFLLDANAGFTVVDVWSAFAPDNGAIVQLPLLLSDIQQPGSAPWNFYVLGWSVVADLPPDDTDWGTYNPVTPAVSTGAYDAVAPGASTMLPVTVDTAQAQAQGALGWLVVSVDDTAGPREADRVPLRARKASRQPVAA